MTLLAVWGEAVSSRNWKKNMSYRIASAGHSFSRLQDVQNQSEVDILFLGSSHTYRGFDTRVFEQAGYSSFNLGSTAQTPIQTKALVERYYDQLNPDVVILEVYPETFMIDGVESGLDIISNGPMDLHALKMSARLNHVKSWNTFLYGSYRKALGRDAQIVENERRGDDVYIPGGFVYRDSDKFKEKGEIPLKEWDPRADQWNDFLDILELAGSKSRVVLVQSPVTQKSYCSYIGLDKIDSTFASLGEYVNFNYELDMNDSLHFFDADHLNQEGVELFNRALISYLEKE